MKTVLFIVQLPPPVHGASLMNRLVFDRACRNKDSKRILVKLNFARTLNDLQKFQIRKLFRAITIVFELVWKILRHHPKIIYFSMVPIGLVLIRDSVYLTICKLLAPKARKIIHLHRPGMYQFYHQKPYIKFFYNLIFRNCEIVHLTPLLAKKELNPLNLKKSTIWVIPNAIVKTDKFKRHPRDKNNILFLSNFLAHKGYFELLDAFYQLSKYHPLITLTLAGTFPSTNDQMLLETKVDELGLSNRVELLGPVYGSKRFEFYSRAGIFILPSRLEYFPLVILEAMSEKCTVITSGRQNLSETFTDREHLLFIDDTSSDGIALAIEELLTNTQLARKIAEGGYQRFLELQNESLSKIDAILTK